MAQWWEHSPPTNVARVQIPALTPYVGWVCCWFSPLLREVFLRVLRFSPLLKNQHFQIPIRPGIRLTKNHHLDVLPANRYLFIFIYLFIDFSLDLAYLCSEKTDVRQPWTLKSWEGKLTLSTQLIKPKFMLRTLADTTPTFIRSWTLNSGGSTRSSTHPGPEAMFTLYPNPNPNPNYTGWLWRWHENFSLWANRTPNVAT